MTQKILVVAAHPDDEALGVAGALARHTNEGDDVNIVFLADGEGARGSTDNLSERRIAANKAGEIIGAKNILFYDFPDNRMDSVPLLDVTKCIEDNIQKFQPNIIYTHHGGDLNIDHHITHRAVITACRPMPESTIDSIYGFEVLSSTEWCSPDQDCFFQPSHHINIENYFDKKIQVLKCYDQEMRDFPHPRSYETVEALAKLRGSHVGLTHAESFTIIRQTKR